MHTHDRPRASITVSGIDVGPDRVVCGGVADSNTVPIRVRIPASLIHHELVQAGSEVDILEVGTFVEADVRSRPEAAMRAYLAIVQGSRRARATWGRRFWNRLRQRPETEPTWVWLKVTDVIALSGCVELSGDAARLANP